jgi:hypothetical protein
MPMEIALYFLCLFYRICRKCFHEIYYWGVLLEFVKVFYSLWRSVSLITSVHGDIHAFLHASRLRLLSQLVEQSDHVDRK